MRTLVGIGCFSLAVSAAYWENVNTSKAFAVIAVIAFIIAGVKLLSESKNQEM